MGDLRDTINALSMVNAGLQTTTQYIYDSKAGNPWATSNYIFNLGGATARIGQADYLARRTGNYLGYTFNAMVPYTDPVANSFALATSAFMTPYAGTFGLGCRAPMALMPMPFFMPPMMHHHCHGGNHTSFSIRTSSFC